MKVAQLTLISDPRPWHLDDATRQAGRAGVARARAALNRTSRPSRPTSADHTPSDHTSSNDSANPSSDDRDLAA